jgi:hypothetical protein
MRWVVAIEIALPGARYGAIGPYDIRADTSALEVELTAGNEHAPLPVNTCLAAEKSAATRRKRTELSETGGREEGGARK